MPLATTGELSDRRCYTVEVPFEGSTPSNVAIIKGVKPVVICKQGRSRCRKPEAAVKDTLWGVIAFIEAARAKAEHAEKNLTHPHRVPTSV